MTENCWILKHLLQGHQILSDRGLGFIVLRPPFTTGKKQLSKVEVDTARQLSHGQIHVERVIGFLQQKYTIW